jgi:DNA-binding SARP family transcriptional activator
MARRGTTGSPGPHSAGGAEIIRRKLAPPPCPDSLVPRPRLERALGELITRHRVMRVCATAGSGKTTAVAEALRRLGLPVAWLTVDHTDAAPGRLVSYIEAALATTLPGVAGTAGAALSAGLTHSEAIGLLAQSADQGAIVFVLDELERLGTTREAWLVVESLIRYGPDEMRIVLISRRDLPAAFLQLPPDAALAVLGEADLAFTEPEAAAALERLEADVRDVAAVVEATGGWVTGVLFDAWRAADHVAGVGGEADPLHGYLSSHILAQLTVEECDFLIVCSLLDEVTAARAEGLGIEGAGAILAALRAAHLPVSWTDGWHVMRCHSRFREYLLDRLAQRPRSELMRLRQRHGRLLMAESLWEDATEELLRAEACSDALVAAEHAVLEVVERLDLAVAEQWLTALAEVPRPGTSPLTVAELMIALAQDDYTRALRVADALAETGEREELAAASPRAAALMAFAYLHAARLADFSAVVGAAPPGPERDAVRYCAALFVDFDASEPLTQPAPTGGPLDAMLMSGRYWLGHLTELIEPTGSPFAEAVALPYRIGALRAVGRTRDALTLLEETQARNPGQVALNAAIGPEVLIDAGRLEAARAAVERGRRLALASGSVGYRAVNVTASMKLALRLERDPAAARAALDELEQDPAIRRFQLTAEQQDVWYGLALLLEADDEPAVKRLRHAVASMRNGRRTLELPTAAVYLSEAEWRMGNEDAADAMADLALETARRQGSYHLLLQALHDFPSVASRRIDAHMGADSAWHELGRALAGHEPPPPAARRAHVRLIDFGSPTILVDDEEQRPGLAKSVELLDYLCLHRGEPLSRERLLDALFDGRADDSARSYLRQALARLRALLPDPTWLAGDGTLTTLDPDAPVVCDSQRFEAEIAEAARRLGSERLSATLAAFELFDRGTYLPDSESAWADERRHELERIASAARYAAAELAYSAGRLTETRQLVDATLRADAYHEAAWRLRMRIASALGDEPGVITAFHGCEEALAQLATTPSPATRQLLESLRR